MSIWSSIRDTFLGTTSMTEAPVGAPPSSPAAYGATADSFMGFDDPRLMEFLRAGRMTAAGVVVNEAMALKNSAVHRAAHLISGSLGMLPFQLFKKVMVNVETTDPETGEKTTRQVPGAERAKDHPVDRLLHKRPNSWQTPSEFKSYMVLRALFDGIAYAKKLYKVNMRVAGGREVTALIPLDPNKVTPRQVGADLVFDYCGPNGKETIRSQDMFWFRSPVSSDGITGTKLLEVAMETIGLAHQAEKASGNVLKNGALVGGVLEHPKALDEPAINRLRTQFEERQSSPENAGKWIVAEDGLKVSINNSSTLKDAQANEQRKFQIEEIGRFTGVPRPLLFLDETSWGSGIEQLGLFFITYCLLSWFTAIEEAVTRSLLSEAESDEYYAKFNEGALLRGSLESQANFFSKALGAGGGRGWMTQNEVRDKFEQNPKEGGDVLPQPITKQPSGSGDGAEGEGQGGDAPGSGKAGQPPKGPDRQRSQ